MPCGSALLAATCERLVLLYTYNVSTQTYRVAWHRESWLMRDTLHCWRAWAAISLWSDGLQGVEELRASGSLDAAWLNYMTAEDVLDRVRASACLARCTSD